MTEIFLGKLPRNTVESELKASLGLYGKIKHVSCQKDATNPLYKHGFITYESEEATERALAANQTHIIRGQTIYILPKKGQEVAKSNQKSSPQVTTVNGTKKKTYPPKWTCKNPKCNKLNFADNIKCYNCRWRMPSSSQTEEKKERPRSEQVQPEAWEQVAQPEASRTLRRPNSVKEEKPQSSSSNGLEKQADVLEKFDFDSKLEELTDLLHMIHGAQAPKQSIVHCLQKCLPLLEIDLDSYEKKLDAASEFHNVCYKMVQNCDVNTKQAFQFSFDGAAQGLMLIVNEINSLKHKADIRPCLDEISGLLNLSGGTKMQPIDNSEVPIKDLIASVLKKNQLPSSGAPKVPLEGIEAVNKLIQGLEQTIFTLKNPQAVRYAPHLCSLAHEAIFSTRQKIGSKAPSKPTDNLDEIVVLRRVQAHLTRLGGLVAKCKICEDRLQEYSRTQGEPYKLK